MKNTISTKLDNEINQVVETIEKFDLPFKAKKQIAMHAYLRFLAKSKQSDQTQGE